MQQIAMLEEQPGQKLWCGNLAQIFAFLCWSQGINCRIIEIMKPGDHHVLNEIYSPEDGRWVMVDVSFNNLASFDSHDRPVDVVHFRNAIMEGKKIRSEYGTGDTLGTRWLQPATYAGRHYYQTSFDLYYFHRVDVAKAYEPAQKFKRYLLPVRWYDIYADNSKGNFLFFIKQMLIFLWIATGVWLLCYRRNSRL
jgi:hypothetical protein